jgi:hypothetical protein
MSSSFLAVLPNLILGVKSLAPTVLANIVMLLLPDVGPFEVSTELTIINTSYDHAKVRDPDWATMDKKTANPSPLPSPLPTPDAALQTTLLSESHKKASLPDTAFKKYIEFECIKPKLECEEKWRSPKWDPATETRVEPDIGPFVAPPTELTTAAS